jgi:S-adenosylmethionine decarboxylase
MAVKKLKLHQFNNLNKTLKFSFYDISYSVSLAEKIAYNKYIDTTFNAKKLAQVLQTITKKIGAHILSISCQDYEPVGASVCVLITEQPVNADIVNASNNLGKIEELYGHLDKSHIAVHTYPEYSPKTNIASFRVDIDVSTCGEISPLKCLNYLLEEFDSRIVTDIIEIDYFVRGFTRSAANEKIFIDHEITNIPDFIDKKFVKRFSVHNTNLTERRI